MPFVTYLGRKLVSSTARKAEDTNSKDLVVKRSTGCESDAPGEVRLYELRLRREAGGLLEVLQRGRSGCERLVSPIPLNFKMHAQGPWAFLHQY